jgi:hypothetical protein
MRYMPMTMDAHEMHTREMQPHKIYTYGVRGHCMHAREIHTCKYMPIACTPEITALIFLQSSYLSFTISHLAGGVLSGIQWCVMVAPNGSGVRHTSHLSHPSHPSPPALPSFSGGWLRPLVTVRIISQMIATLENKTHRILLLKAFYSPVGAACSSGNT